MHATAPRISIIMAVYNSAQTLQSCLDSVRMQTYPHKELIIMDGGSNDGSVEILTRNRDLITYWESKPDRGIYHAWNKALDHIQGDWVHFLGADDYFPDHDVLTQVAAALAHCDKGIRLVYGKEAVVSPQGEVLDVVGSPWDHMRIRFFSELFLPHTAFFHHRSLFADRGKFDESFRVAADSELLLRELKDGKALFVPEVTVKAVRCGGVSKRWESSLGVAFEVARAKRMNGIFPYRPAWILLVIKGLFKTTAARLVGFRRCAIVVDLYRRATGRPAIWTRAMSDR